MRERAIRCLCVSLMLFLGNVCAAQRLEIPRRHDKPPGPPLSPQEAVAKMVVPDGFSVEIVAAEPDVVNPVAMFIDEKGRFWITESLEYPRRDPGPGRDRVKVLEDTDGDGKVDKTTVFADGLNIPSGIAVGYGGVWVANSPDILFMQDTDGDLQADKVETVVTGFGRTDTHELPNSFTWGPDGWLYGLNGVFNYSHVRYAKSNPNYNTEHPGWQFTCAMWRIHPRTREFQLFAQGTSNPWGIAINPEGDFFISACVIDHLWHIAESAYYIRQGGPYPPHTWPMASIVEHKHQKAAYCGITYFDSDVYPELYRDTLYMGNIHGGCINADVLERHGSTYKGKPHPGFPAKPHAFDGEDNTTLKIGEGPDAKLADFLTANDAWFMPVVQTTGPDGCLYILDWYDRYHCYQDANADPAGVERAKGRLYRVRYKDTPHAQPFDLARKSDQQLADLLEGGNEYVRGTARRLLAERLAADSPVAEQLWKRVSDGKREVDSRLRALWTLASTQAGLSEESIERLVQDDNPLIRAWGIRLATNTVADEGRRASLAMKALGESAPFDPYVVRHAAVAFGSVDDPLMVETLLGCLGMAPEDRLIQHLVWQNLIPLVGRYPEQAVAGINRLVNRQFGLALHPVLPRSLEVLIENDAVSGATIGALASGVLKSDQLNDSVKAHLLATLSERIRQGAMQGERLTATTAALGPTLDDLDDVTGPLGQEALILRALSGDADAQLGLSKVFVNPDNVRRARINALETLISTRSEWTNDAVIRVLGSSEGSDEFTAAVISSLGASNDPHVAHVLLQHYKRLPSDLRPRVVEVLTQRPAWGVILLRAVEAKQIDKDALNLNQLQRVALLKNDELQALVTKVYGQVRQERRRDTERVINRMRDFLNRTPGDPARGEAAYKKVCGQCHKIHGEGAEVGPDITRNGRNSWEQLLQNVFDPSAVIGPGYQARALLTTDGRVLTGLPVEESQQRVVLKIQGGKLETIPRSQIELYKVSELSMMPEDLEKQLSPQEIADLFAFLALDKHPRDPGARYLPGAPKNK